MSLNKKVILLSSVGMLVLFICGIVSCSDGEPSVRDKALASGMTENQYEACKVFSNDINNISPEDQTAKQSFVIKINEYAQIDGGDIAKDADALTKAVYVHKTALHWKLASDLFAATCIRSGWPTK